MLCELLLQAMALWRRNTVLLRCWSQWWRQHFHFIERRTTWSDTSII